MDGSSGNLLQPRPLLHPPPTPHPPPLAPPHPAPTPAPAPRLSAVMPGPVRLAVKQWGDPRRPPIVLGHGSPDTGPVWPPGADLLARAFPVVAYDVRGAGQSARPARIRD